MIRRSLSFTEGFFLGQISVVVLAIFFIKFFIFGEPPATDYASRRNGRRLRSHSPSHRRSTSFSSGFTSSSKKLSSVLRVSQPLTTASILAKTYYNVNGHQPESLDWFNVLIAQTIAQVRNDAQQDDAILISLTNVLNGPHKPDFLDNIKVTEINLGEEFPIFSNCRIIPVESGEYAPADNVTRPSSSGGESGAGPRLQARMDVDLSDAITLGIETKLVLNYPKPFVAVMPVALAVSVVRFSGTLSISFIPSSSSPIPPTLDAPSSNRTPTTLTFSFLPDYRLELSTHSLLGSRSRLQDVPKIAQLVEARLHDWFDERCVEPRFQQVALPSFWPRRSNTRGGQSDDSRYEEATNMNGVFKSANISVPSTPVRTRGKLDDGSDEQAATLAINSPARSHKVDMENLGNQKVSRRRQNLDVFGSTSLEGFDSRYRMPGSMPS